MKTSRQKRILIKNHGWVVGMAGVGGVVWGKWRQLYLNNSKKKKKKKKNPISNLTQKSTQSGLRLKLKT